MIKNYIKIAFRYLVKNRVFSVVNIMGLTLGFACFILLALFVADEWSFDRFHSDADRIYRVVQQIGEPDGETRQVAGVAPLVGTEAARQFPEVEEQTRLIQIGRVTVGNEPLSRDYERIWIADANFFTFFDFEFLYGDPKNVLTEPDNLVITESVAIKYFGRKDVVGESLYTNVYEATVAGVIKDFPSNSHIRINTIHTEPTWAREIDQWNEWVTSNWTSNGFLTYYKMRPGFDKSAVEQKLTALVTEHYGPDVEYTSRFRLQPLTDIHLYSREIEGGMNTNAGNPLYIYIFGVVALLVLAIACFNYMNLSTAAGTRRTREVGMRKALGARRRQLVLQFAGEALLLSFVALLLALTLIELVMPYINGFMDKELMQPTASPLLMTGLAAVAIGSGILSAFYPAFFLSGLNPVDALKKEIRIGGDTFSLRKVLVVAQFAISIIMITVTIVIYRQLNYLQEKDPGFQTENLLVIDINSGVQRGRFESIKQEFGKLSEVQNVTVSSRVPGEWKVYPVANVEKRGGAGSSRMIFVGIDEDFLDTYGMTLVEGRNLRNTPADSNSVLLTRSAVRSLGLEDPVGQVVDINGTMWGGDLDEDDHFSPTVVGIIEDFHFQSYREEMRPLMLASYRNPIHNIDYYTLRVHTADWQQTLEDLQAVNYRFDPENPIEYTFLDTRFEEFYRADRTRGELFLVFSGIVIFIACMGLFALASFAIEKRTKEIGIRKVLGADATDITWLLTGEFALLVAIAFFVGAPLAYWAVQSWLQEFAYRINAPWWAFLAAGLSALVIALGTVSFQAVRAAMMNPVSSLRSE